MPYYHELSEEEKENIFSEYHTWEWFLRHYKQPEWCQYSNALAGLYGCWKLIPVKNGIKSIEDCKNCECRKEQP